MDRKPPLANASDPANDNDEVAADSSRWRWLDWWLEPRWRALLTWVALATLTFPLMVSPMSRWLRDGIDFVLVTIITWSPLRIPLTGHLVFKMAALAFLWSWFPPVILRVGLWRTIAWVVTACGYRVILDLGAYNDDPGPPFVACLLLCSVLGLPGLTVTGRRSRPWMSLIGILVASVFLAAMYDSLDRSWPETPFRLMPADAFTWAGRFRGLAGIVMTHLLYGAVMIYGTDPLPRQPAKRQFGGDQS